MAKKSKPAGVQPTPGPQGFRETYLRALQGDSPAPPDGDRVFLRFPPDRADAVQLAPEDRAWLVEGGLPRSFSMMGRYGSIRVPEDAKRLLERLASARRAIAKMPEWADLVILAHMGAPVAKVTDYLCLSEKTGAVWFVQTEGPERTLVNSSLRAYGASLCALQRFSRALSASVREAFAYDEAQGQELATICRDALREIDPACMETSALWPGVIDGELAYWRPAPEVPPTWLKPERPQKALQRRAKELEKSAPHLTADLLQALIEQITTAELSAADELIASRARACIRFFDAGKDDYSKPGVTRFGGDPDLPLDMEWPRLEQPPDPARPYLGFLAQINLSDVPVIPGWPLPRKGMLYLFVRDWEHSNPPQMELRFLEKPPKRLMRRRSPPSRELCDTYAAGLGPRRAAACVRVSLPVTDRSLRAEVARLCDVDEDDVEESLAELNRGERGAIAQLLGYPDRRGEDLSLAIALTERGHRAAYQHGYQSLETFERALDRARRDKNPARLQGLEADRPHIEWRIHHAEELRASAAEWQLFLQVNSHDELGLQINDADSLYLFIREADLVRGRFTSVAAETPQG